MIYHEISVICGLGVWGRINDRIAGSSMNVGSLQSIATSVAQERVLEVVLHRIVAELAAHGNAMTP